jgi:hypothetical protein
MKKIIIALLSSLSMMAFADGLYNRYNHIETRKDEYNTRHENRHQVSNEDYWRHNLHNNDYNNWQTGRWEKTHHDGKLGWWWILGSSWYLFEQPAYPYPVINPIYVSPIVTEPELNVQIQNIAKSRYYCSTTGQYYPESNICSVPWKKIEIQ